MILNIVKTTLPVLKNTLANIKPNIALPLLAYNVVIGPHGITDLMHAFEYKKILQLVSTYGLCISGFHFLKVTNYENIINNIFLFFSAIHFHHDIPVKNKYFQFLASLFFVFNLDKIGLPFFLMYMCIIHVPNHYLNYYDLLNKYKLLSILTLSCTSFSIFYMNNNPMIQYNDVNTIIKGLIVAHIIYEESFTNKNNQKTIFNLLFPRDENAMAIYI